MEYTINIYQIDTENIIYKDFIDYITKDLKNFNPKINIGRYDVIFNIYINDEYNLTNCYKIINKFIKYKTNCEDNFDDNICIYMEIK